MFCTSHDEVFDDECPKCVANWTETKEEKEEKPEPRTRYGDRPDMRLFGSDRSTDRRPIAQNPFLERLG